MVLVLSGLVLLMPAFVSAADAPVSYGNDAGASALRVDDSEIKSDFGQEKPVEKPSKSKLKKPKIGIKNNTVRPEEMKSYHRSESGDVSAQ